MDDFVGEKWTGGRTDPPPPNGHDPGATFYPVYNAGEAPLDPIPPRAGCCPERFAEGSFLCSRPAAAPAKPHSALRN
jgi:hypothetical protein